MTALTVKELVTSLRDLVEWEQFGLQLPGIDYVEIKKIKRSDKRDDVTDAKTSLFDRWLSVYPDACWHDVVKALETIKENSIAEKLRKCLKLPLIHESSKAEFPTVRVQISVVKELA